nr:DUF1642 domain-containing protein [Enterococcus lactis]
MNTLDFKEGQTYICIKANGSWFTEGKEYKVFLNRYNRPMIIDDENDPCYSHYVDKGDDYQFKLKEEQPKVTLDEPQKPVITQLVAGWIEKSTDPFTKAEKIAYLIKSKDGDSYYFCDWFVQDGILTQEQGEELLAWAKRQSYETLLSLYNGYEVEKEPKYIVKIGKLYLKEPLGDTSNFTILTTWDKKCAYSFSSFHMADKHAAKFEGTVEEEEAE